MNENGYPLMSSKSGTICLREADDKRRRIAQTNGKSVQLKIY